jgi:hypothetical protein
LIKQGSGDFLGIQHERDLDGARADRGKRIWHCRSSAIGSVTVRISEGLRRPAKAMTPRRRFCRRVEFYDHRGPALDERAHAAS